MKISKLFHWLYAILMLLPFAFFVPSILYYAFNDNSTMQTVEVAKKETISVDFNQLFDLPSYTNSVADTRYPSQMVTCTRNANSSYQYGLKFETLNRIGEFEYIVTMPDANDIGPYVSLFISGQSQNVGVVTSVASSFNALDKLLIKYNVLNDDYTTIGGFNISNLQCFNLTTMFGSGNEPTISKFNSIFTSSYYPYTDNELMQITYDTGETEQLVSNTDIINYAWESIWDLPLFNWCKVSFVSVPFTYITGLFGLAASNSFNYVFTYFASMSIIWLVFDVIMYVPLLVHRWLDKGIVE